MATYTNHTAQAIELIAKGQPKDGVPQTICVPAGVSVNTDQVDPLHWGLDLYISLGSITVLADEPETVTLPVKKKSR